MRILIIKTGALGDVLRTSFIAQALKEKYKHKNLEIIWITDKKAGPFFINNPYVDRVIFSENKDEIRELSFDWIINLEEDIENCKFILSLKPKKISGFYYQDNKVIPTAKTKEWYNMSALGEKPQNDILKKKNKKTHRQIISEIVGIENYQKYEPFLRLTENQRKITQSFMRRYNISANDLIVGINTGAADRWPKQLSIKKTVQLIDKIYQKFNAKIVLFGGPNEIERNQEILKLTKSPVIYAGCGNNLIEFPAIINACKLFITSDSLGLHIALALKRKTIVLMGPTSHAEIETYGLGEKIIADSPCVCCYKKNCKSMEKIEINKILSAVKKLISQKITLVITAFKEPNIAKAIEAALNQKTKYPYEVIISAPDEQTLNTAKLFMKHNKNLKVIQDPGKGKSFALNLAFSKIKTDILILTDGDVSVSNNTIEEFANLFADPEIGAVTGRPFPQESRKTKYGYWAHFLFSAAHRLRASAFENNSFIECSGYLFAFRKNKINKIPVDVAEDTIIPYLLWQKGYRTGYAEKALVFVKNPNHWKDWVKQKTRTHKSHEKLDFYADTKTTPKVKTFKTEAKGIFWLLGAPENLKELVWTIELIFARLYTWIKYFFITHIQKKSYRDGWERIESAK